MFRNEDSYLAHVISESGITQNLKKHLEGVMMLAEANCPLSVLKNIAKAAAVLHDAGKLSDAFQDYMHRILEGKAVVRGQIDHSSAGGCMIENMFGECLLSQMIGTAIYSHHGLQDCIDMETGESLSEKRQQKTINLEKIEEKFFQIVEKDSLIRCLNLAEEDLKNINSHISNFMRKSKQEGCGCGSFYLGMYERLLLSLLIDSDWTDTSCFSKGEDYPRRLSQEETSHIWDEMINHFEKFRKDLEQEGRTSSLNEYRNEISDRCFQCAQESHNLYRLTVPTGSGKTFSSLRFALHHAKKYQKSHIIYVAPFNSIIEQNSDDIRKAVGSDEYVLEHHSNVFYEEEKEEENYKRLTENWDCPIITTTAVQMLNTLFSGKKSSIRRLYALCNSIIIFDEVQALPIRGTELFHLAVNFLTEFCNTTVILCSATQPSVVRIQENNLYNCKEMINSRERYAKAFERVVFEDKTMLVPGGMKLEELSGFVRDAFHKHGSVLVIVNTKNCAKKLYEALNQDRDKAWELYHLSTSMCPENRNEELKEIKAKRKAGKKIICVSTQLVEAGVNLSFECVIRSMAGLDSLIQAAGRCNRHKEQETGVVYVVKISSDVENLGKLAEIKDAREAFETLLDYFRRDPNRFENSLDSDMSIKAYYTAYYKNVGPRITKYPCNIPGVTLEELLGNNKIGQLQYARKHNGEKRTALLNQAFRIAGDTYEVIADDCKIPVIIPYNQASEQAIAVLEKGQKSLADQKKAARQLQRYVVGISKYQLEKLGNTISKVGNTELLVLSFDYYDKKIGVLDEPKIHFLNF